MAIRSAVLGAVLVCLSSQAQQQPNSDAYYCAEVYKNTLLRVSSSNELELGIESVAKSACNTDNYSLDAGFDSNTKAIIGAIPVMGSLLGSLAIKSNKQFCEHYKSDRFGLHTSNAALSEPVTSAMEQFNACMKIASATGVALTSSSPSPSQVNISGIFKSANGGQLGFTTVSQTFSCTASDLVTKASVVATKAPVVMKNNFAINCTRKPTKPGPNPEYIEDAVTVTTANGLFEVVVPGDQLYGLQSRNEAKRILEEKDALLVQANANLEASKAISADLGSRMSRARPIQWYFWEGDNHSPQLGNWFSCDVWYNGHPNQTAAEALCGDGDVVNTRQLNGFSGGRCGFNSFLAACVPKK